MSELMDKLEIIGIAVGAVAFFGIAFWKTNYSARDNMGQDDVAEQLRYMGRRAELEESNRSSESDYASARGSEGGKRKSKRIKKKYSKSVK